MKKDRKPKSKKQVIAAEAIACVSFLLGMVCIFIPGILSDENGHYENGWVFALIFLGLMILAIVLLVSVMPDAIAMEVEGKYQKYNASGLGNLKNIRKDRVVEIFKKHRFRETDSGFYRKKSFCFLKDSICYYLAQTDAWDLMESSNAVMDQLDAIGEKSANICVFLFLYRPQVTKAEKALVREMASALLAEETVIHSSSYATVIPILVDTAAGTGYYLNKTKGITLYAYGCRLLKKYVREAQADKRCASLDS